MIDGLLTIEEAAHRRGCSAATIWRRIAAGELTPRRVLSRIVLAVEEVDGLTIPAPRRQKHAPAPTDGGVP